MQNSSLLTIGGKRFGRVAIRIRPARWLQCIVWWALCSAAGAADFEFLGIDSVFANFPGTVNIQPYAIVIASGLQRYDGDPVKNEPLLQDFFVYQTRVRIDGRDYYRLAIGNFISVKSAQLTLQRIRPSIADAWIYRRSPEEIKQLAVYTGGSPSTGDEIVVANSPDSVRTGELLERARDEFIDGNYARVIAITDKIILAGNLEQVREALELAGITRERQRKFSQAVRLYETLLDTQPERETRLRIQSRLDGILSMSLTPKARMENNTETTEADPWSSQGSFQQYYQDDLFDDGTGNDLGSVYRALVTNLNLLVQRKTDEDRIVLDVETGLVQNFTGDDTESQVSRASIEYARDQFSIIGGRQRRTVVGVYNRFDGLTFTDLSHSGYQLAYAYGYAVQSSFDSPNSDQPFIGFNLNLAPDAGLEVSVYAIYEEILGLTDRQSIGSEVEYLGDNGYAYGAIDYDIFFNRLSSLSLSSSHQFDVYWSLDLGLYYGSYPTLSTVNALQGQPVESMQELQESFDRDEIYQLADERTGDSLNLFTGVGYRLDPDRYLYFSFSSLNLGSTGASGGVEGIPSSSEVQFAIDYSFPGLLFERDYATLGTRVSDSTSYETVSLYVRTLISGGSAMSYNPRIQLDRNKRKDTDVEQLIVKPSLRMTYRYSDKLSFEGVFGVEYSNIDLPELEDQYTWSLYIGYYYLF